MEIKKSIVENVQGNGTWEGKYGLMYKYEVAFENGDTGEYSSKSADQNKFVIGKETEYEWHDGQWPKVKPITNFDLNKRSFTNNKVDPERQVMIVKQSSLARAMEFHLKKHETGSILNENEILEQAQRFTDWVMGSDKQEPIKETKKEDDLPF
tara:strand:+ start:239 stop:697 length:459 start_codon:yes stop_codon:yes gene_type:complete